MREDSIVFDGVRVDFHGNSVLCVPNLSIPARKLVAIVGPNGGAKTTLLRTILGSITHEGTVVCPPSLRRWAYMAQTSVERKEFPLTVEEYVSAGLYPSCGALGSIADDARERLYEAMHKVVLKGFEKRLLKSLSGGEWQRVQLARMLVLGAEGFILDEPFSAMDRRIVMVLQKQLQDLRDAGKTLLVVTHDLVSVKKFFDYAILLRGEVVACGAPEDVLTSSHIEKAYGWMVDGSF